MRRWFYGAGATCRFELRRSFTVQRIAVSVVLALFPPMMLTLMIGATKVAQAAIDPQEKPGVVREIQLVQGFAPFAIVFLVSLVCLLSLLLWATPNVYSELEGKSWSFIASRPGGRISTYLGKFLASVLVSFGVALIALTLSVLIADLMLSTPDPQRLWMSLTAIYFIACFVYGAVFSMLGTLFFRRSMVVAAGYLLGFEVILATVPAVIGKLTVRFHLQELGIRWIGFFLPFENQREYQILYGEPWPTWANLAMLMGTGLITLLIGALVIVNRQYITSDET